MAQSWNIVYPFSSLAPDVLVSQQQPEQQRGSQLSSYIVIYVSDVCIACCYDGLLLGAASASVLNGVFETQNSAVVGKIWNEFLTRYTSYYEVT